MISVIVPYRDRPEHLSGCLVNVADKVVGDREVLVAEQADAGPFLRGQLLNLAVGDARGDVLVFLDVDCRLLEPLDAAALLAEHGRALLPFDRLIQCREPSPGVLSPIGPDRNYDTHGMCNVLTREQFEASNGFSNLLLGWGPEDRIFNARLGGFARTPGDVGHIAHEPQIFRVLKDGTLPGKARLFESDAARDNSLDSYRQTTAERREESAVESAPPGVDVRRMTYHGIGVVDDFAYRDLLDRARARVKR